MRHSLHIRVHKNYKTYPDQAHTKERALFKHLLQTFHKTKPSIKTPSNHIRFILPVCFCLHILLQGYKSYWIGGPPLLI